MSDFILEEPMIIHDLKGNKPSKFVKLSYSNSTELCHDLFGPQRYSTKDEKKLYNDMLDRLAVPIGVSIFDV